MRKRSRILLVDDDDLLRDALKTVIEKMDLDVLQAKNGLLAFEFLILNSVDLILSDINMPQMTGLELSKAIADRGGGPPVILITGNPTYTKADAVSSGAKDLMSKPFETDQLIEMIQHYLPTKAVGSF